MLLYERESHRHLRQRLVALLCVVLILDAVGGVLIYETEPPSTAQVPSAHAWGAAAESSTAQLVAAGSSRSATSEFSHGLEVFLQVCAVTVVASLAGALGAFLSSPRARAPSASARRRTRRPGAGRALRSASRRGRWLEPMTCSFPQDARTLRCSMLAWCLPRCLTRRQETMVGRRVRVPLRA